MKTIKIILALCCFLIGSESVWAINTNIPGVGVVVKRNNCKPEKCKSTCNHGGASRVGKTDQKGQLTFTIKEAGDYTLRFNEPATRPKANARTARTEGGPIVGTVVKGGKNPGASLTVLGTTNDKGEIEWRGLSAGSYTILLESSGEKCPPRFELVNGVCVHKGDRSDAQEQNVINTTKSNTKDLVTSTPKDCPKGFELKNGECVPVITKAQEQNIVNTTKSNTRDFVISCPEGYTMVSGKCEPNSGTVTNTGVSQEKPKETKPAKPTVGTLNPGVPTTPPVAVPTTHGMIKANDGLYAIKAEMISHFEYQEDFVISNNELTKKLGVEQLVIAKGKYEVNYENPKTGGSIVLNLSKPLRNLGKEIITLDTYNPRDSSCSKSGNSCFYIAEPINKLDTKTVIAVTPILENGVCIKIEVQYKGNGTPKNAGF